MKSIVSLVVAGAAVFALSGCVGDGSGDGFETCNTKIRYLDSVQGSSSSSSIKLTNHSDYVIEKVYSGIDGTTPVSSVHIPTYPDESFIANSRSCGGDEILKIIDDEGCASYSERFIRACDETANFEVVNNF